MISPSIGRVVWYTPATNEDPCFVKSSTAGEPCAALVAKVWGDRMVNLAVFDANGISHSRCSVTLLQDDDVGNELGRYASWMPYQKGQAAKTEALQAQTASVGTVGGVVQQAAG